MHLRILVLSIVVLSTVAFGQSIIGSNAPDAYQVHYFANLGSGDSYIDITNSGQAFSTLGAYGKGVSGASINAGTSAVIGGSICVNIYVFEADEQMEECCSCPVTPNEVVDIDVLSGLSGVPHILQGQFTFNSGMGVALTATYPTAGSCVGSSFATIPEDGVSPAGTPGLLAPGLVAWGTTLHPNTATNPPSYNLTETRFEPKPLLDLEAARLTSLCNFINANGTSQGLCGACSVAALGAGKM